MGLGKEEVVPEGYKRTEVGVIPEGWKVKTIGSEFDIRLGKMLDQEKNVGELYPYLGNSDVQWGRIEYDTQKFIKLTEADKRKYSLKIGDVLVCEGGEVGRSAEVMSLPTEFYYQKALHRVRQTGSITPRYLLNTLQVYASNGFLSNYVTQTSIAHLPKDKFELIPIASPCELEQTAIAPPSPTRMPYWRRWTR